MKVDVAVIGASFAGLSAAMMLGRARRTVVLIDDALPRNRFAPKSHGFLGQDGAAPADIRARGLAEVLAYPTTRLLPGRADAITAVSEGFVVDGPARIEAARIILAFGQRDILPAIPGLDECWGKTANQCPYCHGYELADRTTGLLVTGPGFAHQARHLAGWTDDLVYLENGHPVENPAALARPGLRRVAGQVVRVQHHDGEISAVDLADGRRVPMRALYLHAQSEPASPLATDLGCAMTESHSGRFVSVDMFQRTSVPGVFAAGDLARPFPTAPAAAASGNMAGAACNQDLLGLIPPR